MKILHTAIVPFIFLLLIAWGGCSQNANVNCDECNSIIDKRWYLGLSNRDSLSDCWYLEDIRFNSDGSVDVWRYSKQYQEDQINDIPLTDVAIWEFSNTVENTCGIRIYNRNDINYNLSETEVCNDPIDLYIGWGYLSYSFVHDDDNEFTMTLTGCHSINVGALNLYDYEP